MKKKQIETLLYSVVGVAAIFLIIVVVNFLGTRAKARVDFTAEKAYTLSNGTKAILDKLDTPVVLRFYYSRNEDAMPVVLKNYAQQVEDLLDEYAQAGKGKVEIEKYNPEPATDAEDSARLDGIEGQMLPTGERIYLGIAVVMLNEKSSLPLLTPDRERLLEYDISRAITRVASPEKPTIGILTPLQIFGQPPMMRRFGQQPQEAWTFVTELKRDFNVKQLMMTTDRIDDDIKVLMVVHPKEIGEPTQYAIDQFLMRGGKLIAFLDPNCYFDDQKQQNQMMGGGGAQSSSLDTLLKAWGLQFESGKVVADMNYASKTRSPTGQVVDAPAVLTISKEGLSKDDVVTGQIDTLLMPFSGGFTGTPAEGLKKTTLVKTTTKAGMVDSFLATLPGDAISRELKSSDKELDLALRLTGKFKTAYPNGKPAAAPGGDEKDKAPALDEVALKESKVETAVILIGDADMLNDAVSVQIEEPFPGLRFARPVGGNLNFVQGTVEQMSGDSNLIAVRSRATLNRPLKVIKDMEAKATEKFRDEIKRWQDEAQATQQKLSELERTKPKDQRLLGGSPEQQAEIEKLRAKQSEAQKKTRQIEKDLKREIVALETKLKWWNILGMPLAVAASGICLAFFKRKRTAAK